MKVPIIVMQQIKIRMVPLITDYFKSIVIIGAPAIRNRNTMNAEHLVPVYSTVSQIVIVRTKCGSNRDIMRGMAINITNPNAIVIE